MKYRNMAADLHSGLGKSESLTQFLPHEGIRVVGLVEQSFQLVQLLQREVGPTAPLLQFRRAVDRCAATLVVVTMSLVMVTLIPLPLPGLVRRRRSHFLFVQT